MQDYEQLVYTNARGETVIFGIGSPFYVNVQKDVSGISDLTNTIYSTSSMGQDGNTYVGNRIEPREIEITGKIYGEDKAGQLALRRELLRILNPTIPGRLTYQFGDFVRYIDAKVLESPSFSHPKLFETFDIRFMCLNPFWYEDSKRVDGGEWIGAFSFPFEIEQNNSLSMRFGYQSDSNVIVVENDGDMPCGMQVVFAAHGGDVTNPALRRVGTEQKMKILTTYSPGDTITIDTAYGKKSVTLEQAGVSTNIFRLFDVSSSFLQVEPGENRFLFEAESGLSYMECYILFTPLYLGV